MLGPELFYMRRSTVDALWLLSACACVQAQREKLIYFSTDTLTMYNYIFKFSFSPQSPVHGDIAQQMKQKKRYLNDDGMRLFI